VKQVVDSSQAVENSYSYEAFGQATVGQSDVANPYLFVGGYGVQWESTPSLYFMQARYYGPGVGRFISEDPYGGSPQDPLSLHRYLYARGAPATIIDPEGLLPWYTCYVACAPLAAKLDWAPFWSDCVDTCHGLTDLSELGGVLADLVGRMPACSTCFAEKGEHETWEPNMPVGWRTGPWGGMMCLSVWVPWGKCQMRVLYAFNAYGGREWKPCGVHPPSAAG